jgi:glutaredoxin/glutathione-dependent peroxiredoxin
MALSIGDRLPDATFYVLGEKGIEPIASDAIFAGRTVALVGVPGAFTPTCHRNHLPGFIEQRDAILERGVQEIVVLAVNDAHVLNAWAKVIGASDGIRFLSDGNGDFVRVTGLANDSSPRGMGVRSRRFAMIVEDGIVRWIAIDEVPGQVIASSAARVLEELAARAESQLAG